MMEACGDNLRGKREFNIVLSLKQMLLQGWNKCYKPQLFNKSIYIIKNKDIGFPALIYK